MPARKQRHLTAFANVCDISFQRPFEQGSKIHAGSRRANEPTWTDSALYRPVVGARTTPIVGFGRNAGAASLSWRSLRVINDSVQETPGHCDDIWRPSQVLAPVSVRSGCSDPRLIKTPGAAAT